MKKFILTFASLFLAVAMTASGFLAYLAAAQALKHRVESSDPLPDGGAGGYPDSEQPDAVLPPVLPGDPEEELPPADLPDALPPDEEEDDNTPADDIVDEDEEKKRGSQYIRAKTSGLNVRSGPGTNYTPLGSLDKNDMLVYKGKTDGWYITEFRSKTAYVSASSSYTELYEMEHEIDETIEKIITEGYALLGHPYVYGAVRLHDGRGNFLKSFDASKYDCSSLMQYIYYYGAGVILDVTTRTQVVQGKHVAKKDLKRGDLMFFTNSTRYNKTGVERIGHVALYLGDNYILHTATDHAVIEPISSQRWNYYIESRRVA